MLLGYNIRGGSVQLRTPYFSNHPVSYSVGDLVSALQHCYSGFFWVTCGVGAVLLVAAIWFLGLWLRAQGRAKDFDQELAELQQVANSWGEEKSKLEGELNRSFGANKELKDENTKLREQNFDLTQSNTEQATSLKTLSESVARTQQDLATFKLEFGAQAAGKFKEALEEAQKQLTTKTQTLLDGTKESFTQTVGNFTTNATGLKKEYTDGVAKLREQIAALQASSNQATEVTNNLTAALYGSNKFVGTWGEITLQNFFEQQGLKEGVDFLAQESLQDEKGGLKQPDYLVNLPGEKLVVIDCKVSLKPYEEYCTAQEKVQNPTLSPGERAAAQREAKEKLKALKGSLLNHIKSLEDKQYHNLPKLKGKTIDGTLMYIPVEPLAMMLFTEDYLRDLFQEAAKKDVCITGRSTLLPILKVINQMWTIDIQKQQVDKTYTIAAKIYESVLKLTEDFDKVVTKLGDSQKLLTGIKNRMIYGKREPIVKLAQQLKGLGARSNKGLGASWLEDAEEREVYNADELENNSSGEPKALSGASRSELDRTDSEVGALKDDALGLEGGEDRALEGGIFER